MRPLSKAGRENRGKDARRIRQNREVLGRAAKAVRQRAEKLAEQKILAGLEKKFKFWGGKGIQPDIEEFLGAIRNQIKIYGRTFEEYFRDEDDFGGNEDVLHAVNLRIKYFGGREISAKELETYYEFMQRQHKQK